MPITFPLDRIFVNGFRGHPLADVSWLYYVSAGNRDRVSQFFRDGRHSGSAVFEKDQYDGIPQLIATFEDIVNKFLLIEQQDLVGLTTTLFDYCDWFMDMENGPLRSLAKSELTFHEHFVEPNCGTHKLWMEQLFKEFKRHFHTIWESGASQVTKFDNLHQARDFFRQRVRSRFTTGFDPITTGQMMGFTFGTTDPKNGWNRNAIIPLLLEKVVESTTWFLQAEKFPSFLNNFDTFFKGSTGIMDIVFFVNQKTKPNSFYNFTQDKLSQSPFFTEHRDFVKEIIQSYNRRKEKQDLIKLFALAGHDPTRLMNHALKQYSQARKRDIEARLDAQLNLLTGEFLERLQFEPDATMHHPNLEFILRFGDPKKVHSEQFTFEQGSSGLPVQEKISEIAKTRERAHKTIVIDLTRELDSGAGVGTFVIGVVAFLGIVLLVR